MSIKKVKNSLVLTIDNLGIDDKLIKIEEYCYIKTNYLTIYLPTDHDLQTRKLKCAV